MHGRINGGVRQPSRFRSSRIAVPFVLTHIYIKVIEKRENGVCVCFYLRFIIRTYRVSFLLFYHFTTSTFPGPIHTDTQTVPSLSCLNSKPGKTDLTSRLTAKNGGRLLKGKRSVVGTGQTCLFGFFFSRWSLGKLDDPFGNCGNVEGDS